MSALPENWSVSKLGDVCVRAKKVNPKDDPQKDFVYLDIGGVDNTNFRISETKTYNGQNAPSRARQLVESGDVLFSTVRTYLKKIAAVPPQFDGQIASTGFTVLRGDTVLSSKFLFYYVIQDSFIKPLSEIQRGTSYPAVRDSDVFEQKIVLPPLSEQRRIVSKIEELFSKLDAGVAALTQAKAQLKRYRQSVLAAAVTGELTKEWRANNPNTEPASKLLDRILIQRREQWNGRGKYRAPLEPEGTDGLPTIPKSWTWTNIDTLAESKVGNAFKSADFKDSGIRLLRGENIEPGALRWSKTRYLSESQVEEYRDLLIEEGDIIVAMDRPLISSGLKVAVAQKSDIPCLLVQRVNRLRPIGPISSTFLYINVNTKRFIDQLIGNQTGTQLPHITEKGIRSFAIALPPLEEQKQIVAEVEARATTIDHIEVELDQQLTRANRLRQSILRSAFSGKI